MRTTSRPAKHRTEPATIAADHPLGMKRPSRRFRPSNRLSRKLSMCCGPREPLIVSAGHYRHSTLWEAKNAVGSSVACCGVFVPALPFFQPPPATLPFRAGAGPAPLSARRATACLPRATTWPRDLDQLPYTPVSGPGKRPAGLVHRRAGRPRLRPTGTGKTLIAQAALFEALHTGTVAYYTTPLIALTEQKFQEMQASAVRWGSTPTTWASSPATAASIPTPASSSSSPRSCSTRAAQSATAFDFTPRLRRGHGRVP